MKAKLFLSVLLTLSFYLLSAQVPQGFNYQAIARDGTDPITNPIGVRITIQSTSEGGTAYWIEEHTSVLPNASGLFSLVIGNGVRQPGSIAATFSDINWADKTKYIKTEIDNGAGYVTMGTSQLWSVPYSMVAGNVNDTISKLVVTADQDIDTTALFIVRNKDGQTIFAVYNAGVRIYVDHGAKGKKGGFAIGGFGSAKADAPGQEYFIVNRDSIRAYIYDDPSVKAAKGGFAIGGFGNAKSFTNDYMIISPDSARVYVNNAASTKGKKGGFAIGGFGAAKRTDPQRLFTVSDDSIRMYIDDNSKAAKGGFAIGGFGNAKGEYKSFLNVATDALGIINPSQNRILWYPLKNAFLTGKVIVEKSDSVGENSFASGYESKAIGGWSQALGFKAIARGDYSTAIGKNAVAGSINSFAFGDASIVKNEDSYAFGAGAMASGLGSFAFGSVGRDTAGVQTGVYTTASGNYSLAIGQGSSSTNIGSMSFGIANASTGKYSLALGTQASATKNYSIAMGLFSHADGISSVSIQGNATGAGSFAIGSGAITSGENSLVLAPNFYWTLAAGWYGSEASAKGSIAIGTMARASGIQSISIGNGGVHSGGLPVTYTGDYNDATGYYAVALGKSVTAQAYASIVVGRFNLIGGTKTSWVLTDPLFVVGNGTAYNSRSNALTVLKNGNVGIGTNAPGSYKLYVAGDAWTTGTWGSSDIRWKKNIVDIGEIIDKIGILNSVSFEWRKDEFPEIGFDSGKQIGLIAQDVEKVFPELVKTDGNGYKAVSYEKLSVILLEGMKEQQQQIKSLQEENLNLKEKYKEIDILKAEMEQIKAMIKK
jgi:hypothetical protein